MKARVRVSSSAREDAWRAFRYLAERDWDIALRFLDALEQTFSLLADHPRLGPLDAEATSAGAMGVRKKIVVDFSSYVVIYRVSGDAQVDISRVLHTSRDIPAILKYSE